MNGFSSTRTVTPYLFYDDVAAAVEWLACAFGFRETVRHDDSRGLTDFAELSFGGERVLLARDATPSRWAGAVVYLTVEDIEGHFLRAAEAMARVVLPPTDRPFGLREFCVEDPQGHRWLGGEQVRDLDQTHDCQVVNNPTLCQARLR